MKKLLIILVVASTVVGLILTSFPLGRNTSYNPAPETNPPAEEIAAKHRPALKSDVLIIEGAEETKQFSLIYDDTLRLSTYIPQDMIAEAGDSEKGHFLTVSTNYNGAKNENAMIQLFLPADTRTTMEQLKSSTQQELEAKGFRIVTNEGMPQKYDFSEIEFDIQKGSGKNAIDGTVSIFEHNSMLYQMTIQCPSDFQEGLMARLNKMLLDIAWYDEE